MVSALIQTHYGDLRFDSENPCLWKYYVGAGARIPNLPVDLPRLTLQSYSNGLSKGPADSDIDTLIAAGRSRMTFLGFLMGVLITWWSWRLAGPVAAMVASSFFCLDPNFLAHASLIKNDVPITLVLASFTAAIWLVGERATIGRWVVLSLLLGAALTTKYSGVIAIPVLAFAIGLRALSPAPWPVLRWIGHTRFHRLLFGVAITIATMLAAYVFIWGCYGFRWGPSPDPALRLRLEVASVPWAQARTIIAHGAMSVPQDEFLRSMKSWRPDRFIRTMFWLDNHHVFPEAWLSGFIITAAHAEVRTGYLMGHVSLVGWWYYFPLAMLFKTPLATLVGSFITGIVGIWWMARGNAWVARYYWPACVLGITPLLYMASAMHSHLNLGIRHVLPVYPFLFILMGVTAAWALRRWPRSTCGIIGVLVLGLALETFAAFPNYIPFFNVAAGGWRGGLELLSDSNIDWGQELIDLADWQAGHKDRPLYLAYFGSADPAHYGISYVKMDLDSMRALQSKSGLGRTRPFFAMSAVNLQGQYLTQEEREIFQPFRRMQPLAVIGGSIYVYQ